MPAAAKTPFWALINCFSYSLARGLMAWPVSSYCWMYRWLSDCAAFDGSSPTSSRSSYSDVCEIGSYGSNGDRPYNVPCQYCKFGGAME
jgi:hypothetical protein